MHFLAGEIVTADKLNRTFWQTVRKTSNQSSVSSTTFVDDNELFFSCVAGARYYVALGLQYTGPQAGDIKTAWTTPSGASGSRRCAGFSTSVGISSSGGTLRMSGLAWTSLASYGADNNFLAQDPHLRETGYLSTPNAGTLTLRWSQNVSNATATEVKAGSYIRVLRIA
jgi:hypothetical protein